MKIKNKYKGKSISHNKQMVEIDSITEKQFPYFIKLYPEIFEGGIDSDPDIIALTEALNNLEEIDNLCDKCNEYGCGCKDIEIIESISSKSKYKKRK